MLKRIYVLVFVLLGFGFSVQTEIYRLIEIKIPNHDEVYNLNKLHLTIIDAGNDFAQALVNDREIAQLRNTGYQVEVLIYDYQVYKDILFNRGFYHTYNQLYAVLDSFATDYPDICHLDTVGSSVQGRPIWAMRVTDNPLIEENEPEVRLAGNIHGDEHIGTEVTLFFLRHLLTNYTTNTQVQDLVNNNEFWILPTVNPDGNVANTRRNANNVDLNRDYGYFWDGWGGSTAPSSQVENRYMMQHLEANNISLEYNYHSAAQYVNYPWDYHQADPPDSQHIITLSQIYADSSNLIAINGYDWYQVTGGMQDFSTGTSGALAWTIETLEPSAPSAIDQICYDNRDALMDICARTGWGITGLVKDSLTDSLLYARVEFTEPDRIDIYTDPVLGDFHKMIQQGTYDLKISANGYAPKIINNVSVPASASISIGEVMLLPDSLNLYAFRVVLCRYAEHAEQGNKTQPRFTLGPPDSAFFSLGQNGYVVLDMGSNSVIIDGPGDDFTVFEGNDGTSEGYYVYISNDWTGSWQFCGADTGTGSFNISSTGLTQARYVKITDDGNFQAGQYAGFDLDAIHFWYPTGVKEISITGLENRISSMSVSPNPFWHTTDIRFSIANVMDNEHRKMASIKIHDASGRVVCNLAINAAEPGYYMVRWNGEDDLGNKVPAGVYFVRFETDHYQQIEKTVLLK